MLWEVEIRLRGHEVDREGLRVVHEARTLGAATIAQVSSARLFLLQSDLPLARIQQAAAQLLVDPVTELAMIKSLPDATAAANADRTFNVLFKPGVTDNVAQSTKQALNDLGFAVEAVATGRRYSFDSKANAADVDRVLHKLLANDAIERVLPGALKLTQLDVGGAAQFEIRRVAIRKMSDADLQQLSRVGQLYLSLVEMQTIQQHFRTLDRDPTDIELETIAQTWSEHCSHKTLKGRIRYRDEHGERMFENMLKETVFAATQTIRGRLGADDWCVSVFQDNAGIVRFDETDNVCFKVETHNHPSAIEPYGGANTGLGGVIRDPLGTGMGAKPIFNTDVFCFAPPDTPFEQLPPGVLPPRAVAQGVVSGVRDYGNRMGIPTVNGAVFFDERYLGNPLVYCGTAAMIPRDKCFKQVHEGDLIVSIGGRTGRDGIHGATFSSAELTEESDSVSGGAVQIGNAVMEKMAMDVILQARDRGLYHAITDCGAGGFSSAVGEMGEELGAVVWLDRAPLKYSGLTYTEIWISEAQERMVLAVGEDQWPALRDLCASEGVEASILGKFGNQGRLTLTYQGQTVGELAMQFLHDGRPPVIREAVYTPPASPPCDLPALDRYDETLQQILGTLNVCSKEWIIRQYDHEVQAGSVVKPLVGVQNDGPSDAAVVQPKLNSYRGVVVSNGMNPRYGDLDPYPMALAAVDEALRNCVAVGADPDRIAILDNFCWGNTDRPETLGTLVRAALGCYDAAIAFGTPFISGKDSLNNEFSYIDSRGEKRSVAIPSSLLISAIGQIEDVRQAVTMDLKQPGNALYLVGATRNELGGSHVALVTGRTGGTAPTVDLQLAPRLFKAVHQAIRQGCVRACHDLSEGGLAVSLAEMAFAGGLGADVDLSAAAAASGIKHAGVLLFAESPTRFVVEVPPANQAAFEKLFHGLPLVRLGAVTGESSLVVRTQPGAAPVINSSLAALKAAWQRPLNWS